MRLQVELLKKRIPGNRVILDPDERRRLMKIGAEIDHRIEDTIEIVSIKTYRRWQREESTGRKPGRVGRPRIMKSLRELIVRLARENVGWGVRRIVGELKKLALRSSRSTVRRVLVDEKILPDPDRRAPQGVFTPWRKFIAIQMNVMVAADFFCKTIWTPLGKQIAYVLAFIHLGSRKVFLSPSTLNPTNEWVCQQARNVHMWADEEGIDIRFLLHDHDTKFTAFFDEFFRRDDGGPVLTPIAAPIANCFIESWIGSLKRECLNHFFCFHLRQLDYITQNYVTYHNEYRPHQGLGNRPPIACDVPLSDNDDNDIKQIQCQTWLGGLLKHYYRSAA
jgi:putative transposase